MENLAIACDPEQIVGGLRRKLELPWFYRFVEEDEDMLRTDEACHEESYNERFQKAILSTRKHTRFLEDQEVAYFPKYYATPDIPTKLGKYLWAKYRPVSRPTKTYLAELRNAMAFSLPRLNSESFIMKRLVFSEEVVGVNFMFPEQKHKMFEILANLMRYQRDFLKFVTFENAHFRPTDALKVLIMVSLAIGDTLDELNVWSLFKPALLPFNKPDEVYDFYEPFHYIESEEEFPTLEEQEEAWDLIFAKDLCDIPSEKYYHYFRMSLMLLTNIKELFINYAYLAGEQGAMLCRLGCVRSGLLENLHILCSHKEHPSVIQQMISHYAWKYVLQRCKFLRVHFYILVEPYYDYWKLYFAQNIPLESLYLATGYLPIDLNKYHHWWFDCIIRTIIHVYWKTLKKLSINTWYPILKTDVPITRCLTRLPYLEFFEYVGPLDKLDTLKEICEFLCNEDTRLRVVKLSIKEDSCWPEMYQDGISDLRDEYEKPLLERDITLYLDTYKV